MRVRFPRLPDGQQAYSVIERDDGFHFVAERETGNDGGSGALWPPAWSSAAWRTSPAGGDSLLRAELMVGLLEHVADRRITSRDHMRVLARDALSTLDDDTVDADLVIQAAQTLHETARQWAGLRGGHELTFEWPSPRVVRQSRSRRR